MEDPLGNLASCRRRMESLLAIGCLVNDAVGHTDEAAAELQSFSKAKAGYDHSTQEIYLLHATLPFFIVK